MKRSMMLAAVIFIGFRMSAWGQSQPTLGQQVAVLKALNPGIAMVGVLASSVTEKRMEEITKAAMGQNVEVIFARPKDARDIASFYRKLVTEKGVKVLWLPQDDDNLVLGVGFDYLREQAVSDKVGICVVDEDLVGKGALCAMEVKGGKVTAVVNQKVASLLGVNVPSTQGSIAYLLR